jgi:retron-type reverse transcriptase
LKRHGNLWHLVIDPDNIEEAYRKAKQGKTWQQTVQRVEHRKQEIMDRIRASLVDRSFTTSEYRVKLVHEPKERTIYVLPFAPDRIVQHAVMNVVSPLWDKKFDRDSHACRPGRGQHPASQRVMQFARQYRYALQGDIRRFYPSIHHDTLIEIIHQKIKDPDVLWLLEDIIRSFPGGRNVPIGNLTSQWLGNLYMNEFDRYVRTEIRPGGYVRYNDDFLLFGDDKQALRSAQDACRTFLDERLKLTLSKDRVYPVSQGVDFVGYRHFRDYVLIRKRTARRVKQRIRHLRYELATGQIEPERARSVVASTIGWLQWANAHNFRQALGLDGLQEDICGAIQ